MQRRQLEHQCHRTDASRLERWAGLESKQPHHWQCMPQLQSHQPQQQEPSEQLWPQQAGMQQRRHHHMNHTSSIANELRPVARHGRQLRTVLTHEAPRTADTARSRATYATSDDGVNRDAVQSADSAPTPQSACEQPGQGVFEQCVQHQRPMACIELREKMRRKDTAKVRSLAFLDATARPHTQQAVAPHSPACLHPLAPDSVRLDPTDTVPHATSSTAHTH